MSVPPICTSASPFPAAVPTGTSLNSSVLSPLFSAVWVFSLTSFLSCTVVVVDDLSSCSVVMIVVDDLSSCSVDLVVDDLSSCSVVVIVVDGLSSCSVDLVVDDLSSCSVVMIVVDDLSSCSVDLVVDDLSSCSVVVEDDLSSSSGDGDARLEMCDRRVEYANTLPLNSRESTTIDANACAVLFTNFISPVAHYFWRNDKHSFRFLLQRCRKFWKSYKHVAR